MSRGALAWIVPVVAAVTVIPGVATAASLGPSTIADLSTPVRAVAGAGLVLAFGAFILRFREGLVDQSLEASLESVPHSTFYGLAVHFVLVFAGVYIVSQISRLVGGAGPVVFAITGIGLLIAAGLGFTVVGTILTEQLGDERPWLGLGVGTALAGVVLIALPLIPGVGAWILIASVGIGGSARNWFHASHTEVGEIGERA